MYTDKNTKIYTNLKKVVVINHQLNRKVRHAVNRAVGHAVNRVDAAVRVVQQKMNKFKNNIYQNT